MIYKSCPGQGQKEIAIVLAKNHGAATSQTRQNRGRNFINRGIFAAENRKITANSRFQTMYLQCLVRVHTFFNYSI